MKCQNCGNDVEKSWKYCSRCGASVRRGIFNFSDIFSKMRKDMEQMSRQMDKDFERDIEAMDISPFFKKPSGSGFTIRIVSGTGREPRVDVKTFGNVDRKQLQKRLESLGYKARPEGMQAVHETKSAMPGRASKPEPRVPAPKKTEEPTTEVRREDSKVLVELELPGAREDSISVSELESSIEVKALAGEKAYFKILTVPQGFWLREKRFEKGKLMLEFS